MQNVSSSRATPPRSPWLAVNLSRHIPGLGQLWVGEVERGLLIMTIALVLFGGGLALLLSDRPLGAVYGLLAINGQMLFALWNWLDAYGTARQRDRSGAASRPTAFPSTERQSLQPPSSKPGQPPKRDPWLAVFLTLVFLGAGHWYSRQYRWGSVLLGLGVLGLLIPELWVVNTLGIVPWAAWQVYRTTAAAASPGVSQPFLSDRTAWLQVMLVALLLPLLNLWLTALLSLQVLTIATVPSAAMQPTLERGDRVVVNRLVYQLSAETWAKPLARLGLGGANGTTLGATPQRGDVVLVRLEAEAKPNPSAPRPFPPADPSADSPATPSAAHSSSSARPAPPAIQRVIGLPGEAIAVQTVATNARPQGRILINQDLLSEPYLPPNQVLNPSRSSLSWASLQIPPGHYVVLGDNRKNLPEQPGWTLVTQEQILGRLSQRLWPPDQLGPIE